MLIENVTRIKVTTAREFVDFYCYPSDMAALKKQDTHVYKDTHNAWEDVRDQVWDQVRTQVVNHVWDGNQVRTQVVNHVWDGNQVRNQVSDQVWIYDGDDETLINQILRNRQGTQKYIVTYIEDTHHDNYFLILTIE